MEDKKLIYEEAKEYSERSGYSIEEAIWKLFLLDQKTINEIINEF